MVKIQQQNPRGDLSFKNKVLTRTENYTSNKQYREEPPNTFKA